MDLFPDEVLASVFQWLPCREVATRVAQTCRRWCAVALDPTVRRLCVIGPAHDSNGNEASGSPCKRDLCRRAAAAGHVGCVHDLVDSGRR
ncbi:F-box domain containing protein [Pandoravirus neocaledonia]|uniref:F-box domain containing protein n=1 Tax=Pandoravirus neocaledonia TaxID=2107708 RepID=A0A2U7UDW5_9VIRU|nr:F-box domain containing protein [Pandoravirus neocaledonia]AVK76659.1 F-box domain containing protein [Pandoravirus neocaledonia]